MKVWSLDDMVAMIRIILLGVVINFQKIFWKFAHNQKVLLIFMRWVCL